MTTTTNTASAKAHPFEIAGMGTGPYSFVCIFEMPSKALWEANPTAAQEQLRHAPRLDGGLGTCQCCGMAISCICVIRDGQGRLYGVGSDCVAKTDEPSLRDPAKIARAKRERGIRQARAEAARAKRRAEYLERTRPQREAAERAEAERQAAENARLAERLALIPNHIISAMELAAQTSEFHRSLLEQFRRAPLSDRQAHFAAKLFGRSNSKAYNEAFDIFTR